MTEPTPINDVRQRIYTIRGKQVMLGPDLASLYNVQTKALMQAMRRNLERFPPDFMFQLTLTEWNELQHSLRSQIVTLDKPRRGKYAKYRPFAFTEPGVAMLSSVLKSRQAIQINIGIMRAFIKLRHALTTQRELAHRIEKVEGKLELHNTDIRLLHRQVEKIISSPPAAPEKTSRVRGFQIHESD